MASTRTANRTLEVDVKGFAKVAARRGKEIIIAELWANGWDEPGVTTVETTFSHSNGIAKLIVVDDAPEGFADLRDAYTLYAESRKKGNPEQRGRFNLGEKVVIAISKRVTISTTKGTIVFDEEGRKHSAIRRPAGTVFEAELTMNQREAAALQKLARQMIPPAHICTTFNGEELPRRQTVREFVATLPTEIADATGDFRPTERRTRIALYEPLPGEKVALYEMGIPVVETGDRWHVDVQQKVPLNADRDNVRPSYLQRVRTAVFNEMASALEPERARDVWVSNSLEDRHVDPSAVRAVIISRFGERVVIFDPSDPEGTKIAASQDYAVLPPATFNKAQWRNVKAAGVKPAGQVTPSPKPFAKDGEPFKRYTGPETVGIEQTCQRIQNLARFLLGRDIIIIIANDLTWPTVAAFGSKSPLYINLARVGHAWFDDYHTDEGSERQVELLLHEFAHNRVSDHLSYEFADEVARLGARLVVGLGRGDVSLAV